MKPELSEHFKGRKPSDIRKAQILFASRPDRDSLQVINVAIGNVSLPMHPAMRARLGTIASASSPFAGGVVKYSPSVGTDEARRAFLNIIASAGFPTAGLNVLVTDGGSQAMELAILGTCGPRADRPLMLLDPAYSNYRDLGARCAVSTVAVRRELEADGTFAPPDLKRLELLIREHRPRGLVVIPADNPTGQFLKQSEMVAIARLCVSHGMWLVSDEAYRQLHYTGGGPSSVWALTEAEVAGITGRRLSIETASKVWNACGLRIGALVTDSPEMHGQALAEYTANLCANAIGQYIFGALADLDHAELQAWYNQQRAYYAEMMIEVSAALRAAMPGLIVSRPDAALYSVIDLRDIAPAGFDSSDFATYCASRGRVEIDGVDYTLLIAPMSGFYAREGRAATHPCQTQLRIAFVESPEEMRKLPRLLAGLYRAYVGA